jgi:hypothetical protein
MAQIELKMPFNRPVKITECSLLGVPLTETKRFPASSARSNVIKEIRANWELHLNLPTIITLFKGNSILLVEAD